MMRPIAAALILTIAVAACDSSGSGDCVGSAVEEAISPDGRYVATLFHGTCGAAAASATGLSVRDATSAFDLADQPLLVTTEGHLQIGFEWSAARSLTVALPQAAVVLDRVDTWRDVRIAYE